ncbi:unnamed protein product, partial [Sphenostylis stenocarpa]
GSRRRLGGKTEVRRFGRDSDAELLRVHSGGWSGVRGGDYGARLRWLKVGIEGQGAVSRRERGREGEGKVGVFRGGAASLRLIRWWWELAEWLGARPRLVVADRAVDWRWPELRVEVRIGVEGER